MKSCWLFGYSKSPFGILPSLLAVAIFGVSLAGCGSSMPAPAKTTQVVVLLTSTANDQLARFNTSLVSIALTDSTGKSTTVFTGANPPVGTNVEWMHLNGASEPLPAVSIPQGTYTSATVTISNCTLNTVMFVNQTLVFEEIGAGPCGEATTVNLPTAVVLTGSVTGLSLDLQMRESFTLAGSGTIQTGTISPAFNLTAVSIAPEPTDETNGKVIGVAGEVMSLNANGSTFTAQTTDGVSLTLSTNACTTFQGIAAFSSLSTNLLMNFDASIQSDGSLLATRVEVDDSAATQEAIGPYAIPVSLTGAFFSETLQWNGCNTSGAPFCFDVFQTNSNTVFNVSQQFSNVASLPFPATFGSASFLQGQNVSTFSSSVTQNNPDATAITLRPQTINGTVTAISSNAGFTTYTVTLASYNLFPVLQLSTATLQFPHLSDPTTIVVYADSSATFLNSGGMVNVGSLLRFKGLIFFDNGTMRMDAAEVYDGVAE
jgi:hypothetical protein